MKVIGVKYDNINMDFENLMNYEFADKALFIFNDNEDHHNTYIRGGGNAAMRIYNKYSPMDIPISAGIPTGKHGGYENLEECKNIIDCSIKEIEELIEKYKFDTLIYSVNSYDSPLIGTGIFEVSDDVLQYITNCILSFICNDGEYYILSNKYGLQLIK